MVIIGLTGGIATGKSTAAKVLRALGAQVIDADAIARDATRPGGEASGAILARFGTLARAQLAQIVFHDENERIALNNIVHPIVRARMQAEIGAAASPVVVLDVPLLLESGMENMVDEVWTVYVPHEEQITRVMARDGLSAFDAEARINSQMPTDEKIALSDVAIDTSGTFLQTRTQIETHYYDLLRRSGIPAKPAAPASEPAPAAPRRRYRTQARHAQQQALEAQVSEPILSHVQMEAPPEGVWEDTSTLLQIPEQRTFFSRQPPIFWISMCILLVAMMTMVGIIGVRTWRETEAQRAEERRLEQLAEEKARYKLEYKDLLDRYCAEQALDPALVAAVIYNESRFNPKAESYLGARGLMQIMPDTGEWIAMRLDESGSYSFDNMYDPETNIRYGTWYLGYLARTFDNSVTKMIAGYHAGQNAVIGWLTNPEYSRDGVNLDTIPYPDTKTYVEKVVTAYEIYQRHYYPMEEAPDDQSAA